MVSSQARRDQVALAMERGHTQRQACELMELPRSILNYRSVRAERDAPALDAMRRIAATYPRYGYRRVRIFLRREGYVMGLQRAHRLWTAATGSNFAPTPFAGDRPESGVGLRFHPRCLRQRAEA